MVNIVKVSLMGIIGILLSLNIYAIENSVDISKHNTNKHIINCKEVENIFNNIDKNETKLDSNNNSNDSNYIAKNMNDNLCLVSKKNNLGLIINFLSDGKFMFFDVFDIKGKQVNVYSQADLDINYKVIMDIYSDTNKTQPKENEIVNKYAFIDRNIVDKYGIKLNNNKSSKNNFAYFVDPLCPYCIEEYVKMDIVKNQYYFIWFPLDPSVHQNSYLITAYLKKVSNDIIIKYFNKISVNNKFLQDLADAKDPIKILNNTFETKISVNSKDLNKIEDDNLYFTRNYKIKGTPTIMNIKD